MKKLNKISILLILCLSLSSCSLNLFKGNDEQVKASLNLNQSALSPQEQQGGMIAIVDSIPQYKQELTPNMISFLSTDESINGNWILVDTRSNTISIKNGDQTLDTVYIKENIGVTPGIYSVFSMQQNPLWYANDYYYLVRNLTPPEKFSEERYVKGALGNYAVYLNEEFAIHDSKISSLDVEGIRVNSEDIKKIYSSLKTGALIRVY